MKILLVHNFYGSSAPSGENSAFRAEAALLRNRGHSVAEFTRDSDELIRSGSYGTVKGALTTVWNPFSLRKFRTTLRETRPDIVHVHNTFPLLSPSVLYAPREFGIPTVMTLHNYRVGCSSATALRQNEPCTLCLEHKSVLPALRYGCYRNSRLATAPVAAMIALHRARRTWQTKVDAFIALTEFQKKILTDYGIPEDLLFVKPHFFEDPPDPLTWRRREQKAIFIGRLYEAKGIHILVEAWKQWGKKAPRLEIVGDGPMMTQLRKSIEGSEAAKKITFSGTVSRDEVMMKLAKAKLLILPSLCFEGFPMAIQEAYALGVPVAASSIGSLPSIVSSGRTGALFAPGNVADLLSSVGGLFEKSKRLESLGKGARRDFDTKYTSDKNYKALMRIYKSATEAAKIART